MTIFFVAIIIFDGWLDGSLSTSTIDDKQIQGTIFCILIGLLSIPANLELAKLATAKNLKIFIPVSIIASILFATYRYWLQFIRIQPDILLPFLLVLTLLSLFIYQNMRYGTTGVLANCGVNCFSILYLGLLSGFCIAIRLEFGPWYLLMYIFVVKSADIGAYAIGSIFGKHKFSPKISPGKTWEGMIGAIAGSIIVAIGFACSCDIMVWWLAIIFGICFAFIGQLGDLAESMIKRDAEKKDSSNKVPGFGGILDIIDSPIVAAPFAYLFFIWSS